MSQKTKMLIFTDLWTSELTNHKHNSVELLQYYLQKLCFNVFLYAAVTGYLGSKDFKIISVSCVGLA